MSGNRFIPEINKITDNILKLVIDIVVVIFFTIFMLTYLGSKTMSVGNSMSPTINDGQYVLINRLSYEISDPKRYDVIVFKSKNANDTYLIKRIIGLPGETVQIKDSTIYINNEKIDDSYKVESTFESGYVSEPIEIGMNEYFVLGDNRNYSEDSRFEYMGNVKKSDIIGKAWLIASPFKDISFID